MFMEINFFEMLLRTTGAFFAILILARIIGKKQLSQLTFFHYITGITVGSIASEIAAQAETPFFDGMISLVWWCVLTIIITRVTLKNKRLRILFDGKPTVMIKNGVIYPSALKKEHLHVDELMMMLREKDIYSLDEVLHVTFETNGEIGVMKKPSSRNVTQQDMQIKPTEVLFFPIEVVSDGKIIYENLHQADLDEQWLMRKLRKKNIENVDDVFFAQLLENGSLFVSKRIN